jgi:murein DD-endopeptidase MepM/ murein hydrolase activator NlpD
LKRTNWPRLTSLSTQKSVALLSDAGAAQSRLRSYSPSSASLPLMLGSVCCLGMVTSLFAAPAQAAVSDGDSFTSVRTNEMRFGRSAEAALTGTEVTTQFVVVPIATPVSTLMSATPESTFASPQASALMTGAEPTGLTATDVSPTQTQATPEMGSVTVVQVPTSETVGQTLNFNGMSMLDGSSPLGANPINFLSASGLGNNLLASADLFGTQSVTPAAPTSTPFTPVVSTPIASAQPARSRPFAQAIDLQILAPIVRRAIIPRLPSLDLPPLPGADRLLPGEGPAGALTQGFAWPAQGVFTSGYGYRWGRMHRGIDIAGPVGTPIFAAADGVVVTAEWNSGGFGNLVEIRHADGSKTIYAHNNRILVRVGQEVNQGQQISEMGSTGRSTGPHLHFEIHPMGRGAVNPMVYLSRG